MATAIAREQGGTPVALQPPNWGGCEDDDDEDEPIAYKLAENLNDIVRMSPEDMEKQYLKVQDSEGFESDAYVLNDRAAYLGPRRLPPKAFNRRLDRLRGFCDTAIKSFNIERRTNLKVVEVVKSNNQIVYGALIGEEFYITFAAAPEDSEAASLYQAKVLQPFNYSALPKVFFCRPKPSSS